MKLAPPTRTERWLYRGMWVCAVLSTALCLLMAGGAVSLLIDRMGP